jgi:hypothetical protein
MVQKADIRLFGKKSIVEDLYRNLSLSIPENVHYIEEDNRIYMPTKEPTANFSWDIKMQNTKIPEENFIKAWDECWRGQPTSPPVTSTASGIVKKDSPLIPTSPGLSVSTSQIAPENASSGPSLIQTGPFYTTFSIRNPLVLGGGAAISVAVIGISVCLLWKKYKKQSVLNLQKKSSPSKKNIKKNP